MSSDIPRERNRAIFVFVANPVISLEVTAFRYYC